MFGVKESLVVDCERVETREDAAKYQVEAPFYRMHYDFVLKPAQEIDLDREGLEFRVRDEGPGFDPTRLPAVSAVVV